MENTSTARIAGRIAAALVAFSALHSLFAYKGTKRVVENAVGERHFRTWYRLFYNAQAVLSLGALVAYVLRQPDQEIYRVRGPLKWLLHAGQLAAGLYCAWAVKDYGLARFIGFTDIRAWLKDGEGCNDSLAKALAPRESQGPTMDEQGHLLTGGAFQYSRHPLNSSASIVFWLMPTLTRNSLICNMLGTLYLYVGSLHEEKRLKESFGVPYEAYCRSGVPFFLPRLTAPPSDSAQ